MIANYPHFKRFVYDKMNEDFDQTVEPLPENVDLVTYAREHGGLPSEAFIAEFEQDSEVA